MSQDLAKLAVAFEIANRAHRQQVRKGTKIPYISHVMSVSALALEAGGSVDEACAALLHDVLEDGGPEYAEEIKQKLGEDVLRMVQGCTDGVPDASGKKEPWDIRKVRYINHLKTVAADVLFVSACDKMHNLRSILRDLQAGEAVFERFSAPKEKTIWYYDELVKVFEDRHAPYAREMRQIVTLISK